MNQNSGCLNIVGPFVALLLVLACGVIGLTVVLFDVLDDLAGKSSASASTSCIGLLNLGCNANAAAGAAPAAAGIPGWAWLLLGIVVGVGLLLAWAGRRN